MKKLVSLILAAMLLLSCAAMAELDPAANTFPISEETTTINVTKFGARTEILDWETNGVTQYWQDKLNIDIVWEIIPSETAAEMVSVTMASGELPDVMLGGLGKDMAVAYGAQGFLLPMNDLVDKWGANLGAIIEKHPEVKNNLTAPDGNIYFLAEVRELDYNHTSAPFKMLMNMDWLKNVGKEVPTTVDELYDVLVAFKEQDANGNGDPDDEIPLFGSNADRVGSYIMQAYTYLGAKDVSTNPIYIENGEIKATYVQDGYKEGLAFLNKLYTEGLLDPECFAEGGTNAKMLTGAENGNRIGACETHAYSAIMDLTRTDVTAQFAFIEPLKNAEGVRTTPVNAISMNPMFYIAADSEVAEAAFRWGDAMLQDPYADDMAGLASFYGPEGSGWRRAEEGELGGDGVTPAKYAYLFTWGQPNNDHMHEDLMEYFVGEHKLWLAATAAEGAFNQEAALLQATVNQYQPYANTECTTVSPLLMFAEDEVMEASQIQADIDAYVKESKAAFITGKMSVEADWETYLSTLESMQFSYLMDLYQTAYTRQFGE